MARNRSATAKNANASRRATGKAAARLNALPRKQKSVLGSKSAKRSIDAMSQQSQRAAGARWTRSKKRAVPTAFETKRRKH
jgi:hypothetical protein